MISVEQQIEFMELQAEVSKDLYLKGYEDFKDYQLFEAVLETLKEFKCNGEALRSTRKKCPACGEMFTPKNNLQECCNTKCRVRLHRAKNRLKEFNAKVNEILKGKDPEAKFTVEQIIRAEGKCPFIVNYNGSQYQSDNTRNLLTQLKKI